MRILYYLEEEKKEKVDAKSRFDISQGLSSPDDPLSEVGVDVFGSELLSEMGEVQQHLLARPTQLTSHEEHRSLRVLLVHGAHVYSDLLEIPIFRPAADGILQKTNR